MKRSKRNPTKLSVIDGGLSDDPPWDVTDDDMVQRVSSRDVSPKKTKPKVDLSDRKAQVDVQGVARFEKKMRITARKIRNLDKAYNSPATQEVVLREMLASTVRMLPLAEESYNETRADKSAYAYTNLQNQAQELMVSLKSLTKTDELAEAIVQTVVKPGYEALISYIITELSQLTKETVNANTKEQMIKLVNNKVKDFLRNLGPFAEDVQQRSIEDVAAALKR